MLFAGPGSRTPVTGAPYSAVQVTQFQQTLEGGNQDLAAGAVEGLPRWPGRVWMERTAGPGAPGGPGAETMISIFDPVAGNSHMLNPQKMTASAGPFRPPGRTRTRCGVRPRGRGPGPDAAKAARRSSERKPSTDWPRRETHDQDDPGRRLWKRAAHPDRSRSLGFNGSEGTVDDQELGSAFWDHGDAVDQYHPGRAGRFVVPGSGGLLGHPADQAGAPAVAARQHDQPDSISRLTGFGDPPRRRGGSPAAVRCAPLIANNTTPVCFMAASSTMAH